MHSTVSISFTWKVFILLSNLLEKGPLKPCWLWPVPLSLCLHPTFIRIRWLVCLAPGISIVSQRDRVTTQQCWGTNAVCGEFLLKSNRKRKGICVYITLYYFAMFSSNRQETVTPYDLLNWSNKWVRNLIFSGHLQFWMRLWPGTLKFPSLLPDLNLFFPSCLLPLDCIIK